MLEEGVWGGGGGNSDEPPRELDISDRLVIHSFLLRIPWSLIGTSKKIKNKNSIYFLVFFFQDAGISITCKETTVVLHPCLRHFTVLT